MDNRVRISKSFKEYALSHCGTMKVGDWIEKYAKIGLKRQKIEEELKKKIAQLEAELNKKKAGDAGDTRNTVTTSPLEYECHYMAFNPEKNILYCDGKPIDKYVCMNRHARFASMGKKCYPKDKKFPKRPRKIYRKRKSNWDDDWGYIPEGNRGNIYRGEA